jgi:hypothetical protein
MQVAHDAGSMLSIALFRNRNSAKEKPLSVSAKDQNYIAVKI